MNFVLTVGNQSTLDAGERAGQRCVGTIKASRLSIVGGTRHTAHGNHWRPLLAYAVSSLHSRAEDVLHRVWMELSEL